MVYLRNTSFLRYPLVGFFIVSIYFNNVYALRGVFNLKMNSEDLSNLKRPTSHRMLTGSPMDFHLGGNSTAWDYFVEVPIGTPPQNMLLAIDTGSDTTWINCQGCHGCAMDDDKKGIHLKPYNPEASTTAEIVKPGDRFCKNITRPCVFNERYYDGTIASGYYVKDYVSYNSTKPAKAKFTFGCTTNQTSKNQGNYLLRGMVGILGLGTYGGTILGQMNSSNTGRNVFSMCLDRNRGGGIFAVGKLVKPATVPMMKYLNNGESGTYDLNIQSMMFGDVKVDLNGMTSATFDTGSTVGFLPASVQVAVADLIASKFSVVPMTYYDFHCFNFPENVSAEVLEEVLPAWTFQFSDTMSLSIYPRNYMTKLSGFDGWCIKTNKQDYPEFTLGVPFLHEKLFVYDNENRSIGFMDYDCTSSVEVEGDEPNEVFDVYSHSVEPHF